MSRKWLPLVLAAALAGSVVTIVASPANAADSLPDGGGHAQAGAHGNGSIRPNLRSAVAAPPGYSVTGIDVSSHDHAAPFTTIDWNGLVNSGVQFAYVKATEGKTYTNPYFAGDNQAAKAAGLLVGAYTFARPDSRDPVGDANAFINAAAWTDDSHTLVPFLDMEWPDDSSLSTCYGLSTTDMVAWIQSFLNQVRIRIGRNAMIYTAASWWNQCTGNSTAFGAYPLDVASYNTSPGTLPSGWSTWTLWQYAGGDHSQQGNYDKDVFNGDYNSLRRLAGIDPPPPLTSAPTGFENTTTGRPEVYANAGGDLVQRFYQASDGWSGWSNFGGSLTGEATVFHNPPHGYTEVYANSNGHLVQKYQAGGVWSGWSDLGGPIDGKPTVIFNPKYGTTEIYARSGTHVVYKYYGGSSWSPWMDLGGAIDGDPSVIYNSKYGTTEVYARSGTDTVYMYYGGSSWSAWMDLGGSLSGDPTVFFDAKAGKTEIYARAGTELAYKYYSGSAWYGWLDLGGTISGDPSVIYNPKYGTTEVYATSGTHVAYTYLLGSTWGGWTDLGGDATSDPSVIYDAYSGNTDVFVNSNGNLYEKVYLAGSGWYDWIDLMQ